MSLINKKCVPCEKGTKAFTKEQVEEGLKQLVLWKVIDDSHLKKVYTFPDFKSAWMFVNEVADLAESEGHHPDILLSWGKVVITLFTHSVKGLTENDFILAAKIDQL